MTKYKDYISYILIIIMVIVIRTYVFTPIKVNGDSMEKTLHNGELMILNKYDREYNRFDIVVLKTDNSYLIKRIIGLPGEKIEYKENKLYINDEIIKDEFANDIEVEIIELLIKNDEYFVMGDNRGFSMDSRIIGTIKKDNIVGKTNFVLFPFSKFGKVE